MECEQGKSWNRDSSPYRFDCFICNIYSYKSPILLCAAIAMIPPPYKQNIVFLEPLPVGVTVQLVIRA